MLRSDPDVAGRYANQGRYVETDSGRHHFPSPAEVPALMGDFPTEGIALTAKRVRSVEQGRGLLEQLHEDARYYAPRSTLPGERPA